PRPENYKVSATYRDGFRSAGTLTVIGRNSNAKARRIGEAVLQRVRESGFALRDELIECLGNGQSVGTRCEKQEGDTSFGETVLRVAVESDLRAAVECFTRELIPFVTAGPQGTTGYAEGRPRVHRLFRYWPTLVDRERVTARVETKASASDGRPKTAPVKTQLASIASTAEVRPAIYDLPATVSTHLYHIACARSGDKGINANIGVIARRPQYW